MRHTRRRLPPPPADPTRDTRQRRVAPSRAAAAALVLVLLVAAAGSVALGQQEPPLPPDEPGTFEGSIVAWDDASRNFTVRGAGDNEMDFWWDDATTIDGAPRVGDNVTVDYAVADGRHVATHIAVQEAEPVPGDDPA